MNNVLSRMVSLMKNCEIYSLNENSLVYKELCSYAIGINMVKNHFEMILKELFILTAESYGLSSYQAMFDYDLPDEQKKQLLISLNSQQKGFCDIVLISKLLSIIGNDFEIDLQNKVLKINGYDHKNLNEISKLDSLFSDNIGLTVKLDFSHDGQSWDFRDDQSNTFNYLDKNKISFNAFDTLKGE